ncbi:MAG: hypothetical protein SPK97_04335 [Bacteroidales bacterium]|nr:hypothetical protein [Bacteroidales bacterium]
MTFIFEGITTLVSLLHPNVARPIHVIPAGIRMDVTPHFVNANNPIS